MERPVMQLFEAYLGAATAGRVGAQHALNAEYFKRIDAKVRFAPVMIMGLCGLVSA